MSEKLDFDTVFNLFKQAREDTREFFFNASYLLINEPSYERLNRNCKAELKRQIVRHSNMTKLLNSSIINMYERTR